MTTVTLDEKVAQALDLLRRQAAARGISFEHYLADLAVSGEKAFDMASRSPHKLTQNEFRKWLHDVSADMPPLPPLPSDFSRADLYNDHD
jgi:hypothetical protein